MATDPIKIGNVLWPNKYQYPTGIYNTGVNTAMDPTALAKGEIPADTSKVQFSAKVPDTTPSTDSTKGRVIDVRV